MEPQSNGTKRSLRIKIISMGNAEVGKDLHTIQNLRFFNISNAYCRLNRMNNRVLTSYSYLALPLIFLVKSCVIKRYCEKRFVPKYLATIGIDYGVTRVNVKGRDVKVNIFDMSGHPLFYDIRNEFYADTQGVLLVYDVSLRSTFESLESWMDEIRQELGNPNDIDDIIFVVCANKRDKKRVVDEVEGKLWADAHGFLYFEVSALTGDGISEMFQAFFDGIILATENGGSRKLPEKSTRVGYTKEQVEAIQRLKNAKDDFQRLGLTSNATTDDVNKAFRKLSVLLHPDKSVAPGSEEAFKILVAARTSLLRVVSR